MSETTTAVTRPRLHYTAPSGWVNDPLALTYHRGRYHLFFQHVPASTTWAPGCHWGHATSDDLLHWETGPVVLSPDGSEDGCWSGNLVRSGTGETVVFYTAVDAADVNDGRVRRATPVDAEWSEWEKQEVVARRPDGERVAFFRDPFVYRDGDLWRMLVGGGTQDGLAVAWMFTSPDLHDWRYAGRAADGRGGPSSVWECPVLVEVDGSTALVVAAWEPGAPQHVAYAWCTRDGDRLVTGSWQRLSYGPCYYAASAFVDADGRPGLIHWLREVADAEAGWAGAHSLPHLLRREGDRLVARPHPHLEARRGVPTVDDVLPHVADVEWGPAGDDALVVTDQGGLEQLSLRTTAGELRVVAGTHAVEMPWSGGALRVVLDGPVMEVFGADGVLALPVALEGPLSVSATGDVVVYPVD